MSSLPFTERGGDAGPVWLFQPKEGEQRHPRPEWPIRKPHHSALFLLLEMLTLNLSKVPQGYPQALWASELGSFSPGSSVLPRPKPRNQSLQCQSLPPSQVLCPGQTQKENNSARWTSGHLGEGDKPLGHWQPPGLVSLGAPTFPALSPMGPARGPGADVWLFSPQATPVPRSVQLL